MSSTDPAPIVAEIAAGLDGHADPRTKAWWERYLKGAAEFRGVKMAETRRIVSEVVDDHRLGERSADAVLDIAAALFAQRHSEDKLAGVLLLAEHALARVDLAHLDRLAAPLADGSIEDWNVCDWYCVKVLGPFVVAEPSEVEARSRGIAAWIAAAVLWQRRSAAVAFVDHAATAPELFDGFTQLLLEICRANVADPTRWSQTSVGWLLRELSRRTPETVERFLADHPELSAEARKNARKYL